MRFILREAPEDYIRIGNKIYPKNAANYGYQSADEVTRQAKANYEKELADEEQAKLTAELQAKAQEVLDKISADLEHAESTEDKLEVFFKYLVPPSANCETVAGELVRAMMKIMYRDWNDGDVFYDGYGLETCGPSAAYIHEKVEDEEVYRKIEEIAEETLEDSAYTEALNELAENLIDYILDHRELLATPNEEDMYDYNADIVADFVTLQDCDIDTSSQFGYEVAEGIRKGITEDEYYDYLTETIKSFVSECFNRSTSAYVSNWARDAFEICDCTPSEMDTIDESWPSWFRSFIEDMENEYPLEYDSEEDEYEESLNLREYRTSENDEENSLFNRIYKELNNDGQKNKAKPLAVFESEEICVDFNSKGDTILKIKTEKTNKNAVKDVLNYIVKTFGVETNMEEKNDEIVGKIIIPDELTEETPKQTKERMKK